MSMKNYCATLEEAQMSYDFHLDIRLSPTLNINVFMERHGSVEKIDKCGSVHAILIV